ncbi:MAG: glucose-6-phosphate isomerase, partial [Acidimicrobiia bacterium]|nr:glucose-6-phosphate isomerase [Acidimicrobiia bacterium]
MKQQQAELNLRQAFADDPGRAARLSLPVGDLMVDLSKHLITDEVMTALVAVARRAGLAEQ